MRPAGQRAVESGEYQPGPPPGWARVAALMYIAALIVVTLLPVAWFGGLEDSPGGKLADLFGNVLLFAPVGFLLPLLVPAIRRWWQVLAVGAGISLLVELYQLTWPLVRNASVDDLLMNALGALLGFAALRLTGYRRATGRS